MVLKPEEEEELIRDLGAPVKSFQVFALEQAIRSGSSARLLAALEARKEVEADEECLLLLSHALLLVRDRLTPGDSAAGTPSTEAPLPFQEVFPVALPQEKLNLLLSLTPGRLPALAPLVPDWATAETNPVVKATLIRTFSRVWPADRLKLLSEYLYEPQVSVRMAALESLATHAPHQLARHLPTLLTSPDPRFRAMAVQGLAAIDPGSAAAHLSAMGRDPDPHTRLCALRNAPYLPFERVKPFLLEFLGVETSSSLLRKAGLLLIVNCDAEIPFRLVEVMASIPAAKAEVLAGILSQAVEVLLKAPHAPEDPDAFRERLGAWRVKVFLRKRLQELLARLPMEDNPEPLLWEFLAAETTVVPPLQELLLETESWDLDPSLRFALVRLGELVQERGRPKAGTTPFADLPTADKIKTMASWETPDRDKVLPLLTEILQKAENPPGLLAAAFRTAMRLGSADFVPQARRNLRAPDESLLVAALEYASVFDPDQVFPLLGYYLHSRALRIRTTALRILQRSDPARALGTLQSLFRSQQPAQLEVALGCLVYFDFPAVRGILSEFLSTHPPASVFAKGLNLFRANPDPENLFFLYCLEQKTTGELQSLTAAARTQLEEQLTAAHQLTAARKAELVRRATGMRETASGTQVAPPTGPSLPSRFWSVLVTLARLLGWRGCLTFGLIVLAGGYWSFRPPPPPPEKPPPPVTNPVIGRLETIEGKIQAVLDGGKGMLVVTSDHRRLYLTPGTRDFSGFLVGDRIRATVRPIRFTPDGIVVVTYEQVQQL